MVAVGDDDDLICAQMAEKRRGKSEVLACVVRAVVKADLVGRDLLFETDLADHLGLAWRVMSHAPTGDQVIRLPLT